MQLIVKKNILKKLFEKFGANIKFYQSESDKHGITRGREAFLAIWDDKAILSFRGTEGDDKLEIKLREKGIFSMILRKVFSIKV